MAISISLYPTYSQSANLSSDHLSHIEKILPNLSVFKAGDVVVLKSSLHRPSPTPMTVETGIREDGLITVAWIDHWRRSQRDVFQPECLELYK